MRVAGDPAPGAVWCAALHGALVETDPEAKCRAVQALPEPAADFRHPGSPVCLDGVPGRPARPELVSPAQVKRRRLGSVAGRVALVHAVAHIEFNAINLALDAAWRFAGMPRDYYADWLSVARDEARHFAMLAGRLRELGAAYGDLPAHNGLWEAAEKTAGDVLARMALVPRVLEARGLDVTPGMIERLQQAGDHDTVALLRVILDEEVRHVAIGTRWFRQLCAARGLPADESFARLLAEHQAAIRPPLNEAARRAAGFSAKELALCVTERRPRG